jgi:arylsulfatase A-like enzyme
MSTGTATDTRPVFFYRRHYNQGVAQRTPVNGENYAVRFGEWKYIFGPDEEKRELYHLTEDPDEMKNRYQDEEETSAYMHSMLIDWLDRHRKHGKKQAISEDDAELLRSLGYVE